MVETKNNGNFCMQNYELTEDTVEHQPRKDLQMEIASVSGSTYKHQRITNIMHTETPFCKKFFGIGEQSADMPTSALIYPCVSKRECVSARKLHVNMLRFQQLNRTHSLSSPMQMRGEGRTAHS